MINIVLNVFVAITGCVLVWIAYRDRSLYSRHRDEAYLMFVSILDGADPSKEPYRSDIEDWVRAYQEE